MLHSNSCRNFWNFEDDGSRMNIPPLNLSKVNHASSGRSTYITLQLQTQVVCQEYVREDREDVEQSGRRRSGQKSPDPYRDPTPRHITPHMAKTPAVPFGQQLAQGIGPKTGRIMTNVFNPYDSWTTHEQ